jgi:hypothetical protein
MSPPAMKSVFMSGLPNPLFAVTPLEIQAWALQDASLTDDESPFAIEQQPIGQVTVFTILPIYGAGVGLAWPFNAARQFTTTVARDPPSGAQFTSTRCPSRLTA